VVSHVCRDGALKSQRPETTASRERGIAMDRWIGRHLLRFDAFTSRRMRVVPSAGTTAELLARKVLAKLGLRFRVDNRDLPGSPDIANRGERWAVFVQGCFWHAHGGCPKASIPKRNRAFWLQKFASNKARDKRVARALRRRGYAVVTVWQCELKPEVRSTAVGRIRRVTSRAALRRGVARWSPGGPPRGTLNRSRAATR
jgi:DNA mismatch endonuclease (patch repair protein)